MASVLKLTPCFPSFVCFRNFSPVFIFVKENFGCTFIIVGWASTICNISWPIARQIISIKLSGKNWTKPFSKVCHLFCWIDSRLDLSEAWSRNRTCREQTRSWNKKGVFCFLFLHYSSFLQNLLVFCTMLWIMPVTVAGEIHSRAWIPPSGIKCKNVKSKMISILYLWIWRVCCPQLIF